MRLSKKDVDELIASGYARTSNRYGLVSRIDREDWREFCKENRYPVDADWYRRVLSKDKFELGRSVGARFPNSMQGPDEFKVVTEHAKRLIEGK